MDLPIPELLSAEHEELHAELARALEAGGRTGDAAKEVAEVLHPHFIREEEIAMPPLALLKAVAAGKLTTEMFKVLRITEKLEVELPQMLEQHRDIFAALEKLAKAAKDEDRPEYVRFAEKLKQHARMEEEILYPASRLIGRYVGLMRGQ